MPSALIGRGDSLCSSWKRIKETAIFNLTFALPLRFRLYSPSVKKDKGRNSALLEVIYICTCGMYLRVPEGSIRRLPSEQVGGV
jgi:hypothetical protein